MSAASFFRRYRWHWAGGRPQLFVATVVVLAGVNWLGGLIVNTVKLPIFGDMMGTILAGALFGPVRLNVEKADRIELVVDFGEHGDLQDRFNWVDTALIR